MASGEKLRARTSRTRPSICGSFQPVPAASRSDCARVWPAFGSLLVQIDQWDTSWGPKNNLFNSRYYDDASMAAAPAEICQFVVPRSLGGRLGYVIVVRNRLRRMRGRFDQWIQIKTGPQQFADNYHDPPKFWIQSSLGSPKHRHLRCGRLPDPKPILEGVQEPI